MSVILKGTHRGILPNLGIHFGRDRMSYEVTFTESCRYDLGSSDQLDWNKLFGWSYGLHHKNSIRVGWRYFKEQDCIELSLYCYINGTRVINQFTKVGIGTSTRIQLTYIDGEVGVYTIEDNFFIGDGNLTLPFKKTCGYDLGLYFGGNRPAPHKMNILMNKYDR